MRALSLSSFEALKSLDDMRLLLNSSYRVQLRAKDLFQESSIEKNVKQFCGELLDRCVPNHWKTTMRQCHLPLSERVSIASSLFSVRKLVASKKPRWEDYVRLMTTPQPAADPNFLTFASQEIGRIFEVGWDRGYWSQVNSFVPPTKSNIDKKKLGSYRSFAVQKAGSRDAFLRWAGGTVTDPINKRARATAVYTGGKWRTITLSDMSLSHLLPLHRCLYNRLTKEKWLLRGAADPSRFDEFVRREGEVFVSGDYEGATDNLNIQVSELVMRRLFDTATHIPTRVREEALLSLRLTFVDKQGLCLGQQARGQLMGSPLSFPLLCLINYLTFRYAVRREVPVKINGDDIIFRCTEFERENWFREVSASGLKVSVGKTLVHGCIFSLNSSYFRAGDSGVTTIPHFRASNIFKKCEDMVALTGRVAQIKRDLPVSGTRLTALVKVIRLNLGVVYPSQGSFSRRYCCSIPQPVLKALRLQERESFYRGLPFEPGQLEKYEEVRQQVVPDTWTKEKRVCAGDRVVPEQEIAETLSRRSWEAPMNRQTRDEYWERVRNDSFRYVKFSPLTFHLYRKFTGTIFRPTSYGPVREKKGVWVEREERGAPRTRPVAFQSGGVLKGTISDTNEEGSQ